jgi:hypothetical protein
MRSMFTRKDYESFVFASMGRRCERPRLLPVFGLFDTATPGLRPPLNAAESSA